MFANLHYFNNPHNWSYLINIARDKWLLILIQWLQYYAPLFLPRFHINSKITIQISSFFILKVMKAK